jgi:hypothetical protein
MSFTTKEYIVNNNLHVEDGDTKAYRLIAEHLRRLGFEQRRRFRQGQEYRVWEPTSTREQYLQKLDQQLQELEKYAGVKRVPDA